MYELSKPFETKGKPNNTGSTARGTIETKFVQALRNTNTDKPPATGLERIISLRPGCHLQQKRPLFPRKIIFGVGKPGGKDTGSAVGRTGTARERVRRNRFGVLTKEKKKKKIRCSRDRTKAVEKGYSPVRLPYDISPRNCISTQLSPC